MLALVGTSEGVKNVGKMGMEGEIRAKSNLQYAVSLFQKQQGDVRMSGRLFSSRSKKCDSRFLEQIWLIPVHPPTLQHLMHGRQGFQLFEERWCLNKNL